MLNNNIIFQITSFELVLRIEIVKIFLQIIKGFKKGYLRYLKIVGVGKCVILTTHDMIINSS